MGRRDLYKIVNQTDLFPLPFCKTHWVEDKNVAARGIAIWPYMIELNKILPVFITVEKTKK